MTGIDAIEVCPYDPLWPEMFNREAEFLERAFTGHRLAIEHIGSTAVPGLDAKPVIDIMLGFLDEISSKEIIENLEGAGYEWWEKDPHKHIRLFFVKWNKDKNKRTHQVHAMLQVGSEFWKDQIAFRDKLRAEPILAMEYGDLKKSLMKEAQNDRHKYIEGKTAFVKRVLNNPAK